MVHYKLIYFDARGKAEPIRLLFTAAGVKFEDVRVGQEEWAKLKPTMPGGQVPVLEIDGKRHGQSKAIAHYLAEEFGFYGKNNIEKLLIDEIGESLSELVMEAFKIAFAPDAEKTAMRNKLKETMLPVVAQLNAKATNGHFVGGTLSLADIGFFHFFDTVYRVLEGKPPTPSDVMFHQLVAKMEEKKAEKPTEYFPNLVAVIHRVSAHEKIAPYLKSRPETKF